MKKQNTIGFLALVALILVGWSIYQTISNNNIKSTLQTTATEVAVLTQNAQILVLEQQALLAYIDAAPDSVARYCTEIRLLAAGQSFVCDDLEARLMANAGAEENWAIERMQLQQQVNEWEQQAIAHKRKLLEKDSAITQKGSQILALNNKNYLLTEALAELRTNLESQKADTLNFMVSTGNKIRYMGQIRSGRANGTGSGFWPTGGYYHGEWRNNQRHGQGLYVWKEGHRYVGQFINDQREGEGTYLWSNGERYAGQWKNNQRSGIGTLYAADGTIKYAGNWVNDKPQ